MAYKSIDCYKEVTIYMVVLQDIVLLGASCVCYISNIKHILLHLSFIIAKIREIL